MRTPNLNYIFNVIFIFKVTFENLKKYQCILQKGKFPLKL